MSKEFITDFIAEKFKDKVDKARAPYICHLITVANIASDKCWDIEDDVFVNEVFATALLHDIFEDTNATEDEIRNLIGVDNNVIQAVKILTRSKDDTYMEYIKKVSTNKIATLVKLADLEHNMDITRYDTFNDIQFDLLKRYHKAYKHLINLTKGSNYERV